MRLFERYLIRRGEGTNEQYLCSDMRTFSTDIEDAWYDDDFRIALLVFDEQVDEVTMVHRWWWFGWHEEVVEI